MLKHKKTADSEGRGHLAAPRHHDTIAALVIATPRLACPPSPPRRPVTTRPPTPASPQHTATQLTPLPEPIAGVSLGGLHITVRPSLTPWLPHSSQLPSLNVVTTTTKPPPRLLLLYLHERHGGGGGDAASGTSFFEYTKSSLGHSLARHRAAAH